METRTMRQLKHAQLDFKHHRHQVSVNSLQCIANEAQFLMGHQLSLIIAHCPRSHATMARAVYGKHNPFVLM